MVEVFRTNVNCQEEARMIIRLLLKNFPASCINFDLEDCDRILRIEDQFVSPEKTIALMQGYGFSCNVLE